MRFTSFRILAALGLALGLSACATHQPLIATSEPSFVDRVNVDLRQSGASPRFAETMRSKTRREATRYGRSGAAKELRISVMDLHYKNPAMALLVGDANRVKARVAVLDAASGKSHGEFDASAIDNFAINGVVGAVMAATQNTDAVDGRLAENLASNVLEQIYGTAAAKEARKRPAVDVVDAPAETPAVSPTPSAPAKRRPAPAGKAEPKTAMAERQGPAPIAR